jgi:uncharacterized protein (TIGR03437 family)
VNSPTHPATKGSFVSFYANGLGVVTPPLTTGQAPPASPLSVTAPVSAVVDGYSANVTYAGAAPGFPGLYQINMQIPLLAGSGARQMSISIPGGGSSQNFVTIFVQ